MAKFKGTVNDIEDNRNKVTSIGESPTDTEYPSAKAVKDYVDEHGGSGGGIPMSYLVTSMSSSSTDNQVPSAKCVYDAIQAALYVDTTDEVE
jgi:hypothetical protein